MIDCPIDNLVMLLSTDWFLGHWPLIGLDAEDRVTNGVQAGCRQIVSQIIDGASQYWHASFSDERQLETVRLLKELLSENRTGNTFDTTILEILYGPTAKDSDKKLAGLLAGFTHEIAHKLHPDGYCWLSLTVAQKVSERWLIIDVEEPDFEAINLNSNSKWDIYIRGLSPDLPTMLSDFVCAALIMPHKFVVLWNSIKTELSDDERRELVSWYRFAANKEGINELQLPSWMD